MLILVRTLNRNVDVSGLFRGELGETDLKLLKVETSDLLIEFLGDEDDLLGDLLAPEHELSKALIGEGGAHNEAWVASGATKVDKTTLSKKDDSMTVREDETINLGLDGITLDARV